MYNYASLIKERVPLVDLLRHYGYNPTYDRMPCPFHNGEDRNMLVSNNVYKCFVCGEHGDVISFVRRRFGLNFKDALAKINDDFGLGLPISTDLSPSEKARLDEECARTCRVADEKRQRREFLQKTYQAALDKFAAYDVIMMRLRPVSPASGFSDVYCEAATNIDRAWCELKEIEAEIFAFEKSAKSA